ncbi:MAG: hypothetical protein ACREH4_05995, partial [Vitreimonas sp.]
MIAIIAALVAFSFAIVAPACAQPSGPNHPAIGFYRLPGEGQIYVEYVEEIDSLAMVDFPAGRVRQLQPDGEMDFTFGPTLGESEPVVGRLTFRQDRLELREGAAVRRGRRTAFRTEEVTVASDGLTLAGTLTLPRGRGPHPAIILLH